MKELTFALESKLMVRRMKRDVVGKNEQVRNATLRQRISVKTDKAEINQSLRPLADLSDSKVAK